VGTLAGILSELDSLDRRLDLALDPLAYALDPVGVRALRLSVRFGGPMRRLVVSLMVLCGAGALTYFLLAPVTTESVTTDRDYRTTTRTTRWGLVGYRVEIAQTSVPRDDRAPTTGQGVRESGPSGQFSKYNPSLWHASVAAVAVLWALVLVGAFVARRKRKRA
jgi:hypothetical protein